MGALSAKLRSGENGMILWWCPGCDGAHQIGVGEGSPPRWHWNGDVQAPTFSPSVLVRGTRPITDDERARIMAGEKITPEPIVCHCFVRAGQIQFLGDCTHSLRGQTVPMPDFDA